MKLNRRVSIGRRRCRKPLLKAASQVRRRVLKRSPRSIHSNKQNAVVVSDSGERNWLNLPREVVLTILQKLNQEGILRRVQGVCSLWRKIAKDPFLWSAINMRSNPDDLRYNQYQYYESMCRRAIGYSCGELVDISIENFATDDLLRCIADSARHLRRLRLVSCVMVTNSGLCEAAEKLFELEEVDISMCNFSEVCIDVVGRSCPKLKSFKFNIRGFRHPRVECDDGAFAIARTMTELRHLQLFGNKLTNHGLLAILDGCSHLESLDLRQCFNLDLEESLGKRCAQQIKNLRRPHDSTNDYPFKDEIDYGSLDDYFTFRMDSSDDEVYYPSIDLSIDDRYWSSVTTFKWEDDDYL